MLVFQILSEYRVIFDEVHYINDSERGVVWYVFYNDELY